MERGREREGRGRKGKGEKGKEKGKGKQREGRRSIHNFVDGVVRKVQLLILLPRNQKGPGIINRRTISSELQLSQK